MVLTLNPKIKFSRSGGVLLLGWLLLMSPAFGYVRVEQVTEILTLNGERAEIKSLILLEGDKKRIDSTIRTLGPAAHAPPSQGTQQVTIVRLDKELIWKVNRIDRTHTERTFASLREKEGGQAPTAPVVKIEAGGERKQINGYPTESYLLTLAGGKEESGPQGPDGFTLVSRVWMTRETSQAINKLREFDRKLHAKLGAWEDLEADGRPFLTEGDTSLERGWPELQKAIRTLPGYPIRVETQVLDPLTPSTAGGAERSRSPLPRMQVITEVKGIYTSVVFCSCTDKEKLFELWGAFRNLQAP